MSRRKCSKCKKRKPKSEFGTHVWCRECKVKYDALPEQRVAYMLRTTKRRARSKGLAYDLDQHRSGMLATLRKGRCELSGLPLRFSGGLTWDSPSVDRIDPAEGYVYSNIRIVCHGVNSALGNWGEVGYWSYTLGMAAGLLKKVFKV